MKISKYKLSYVRESELTYESQIKDKADIIESCKVIFKDSPIEYIVIFALDGSNNIIGYNQFEGTTNAAYVFPANVFRFLLSVGASNFIMAHNHPGGSLKPSKADWKLTNQLAKAGSLLEIKMLDHIIITEDSNVSLTDSCEWKNH